MISNLLQKQWSIATERKWDRTYWLVDLHGTVIKPNYKSKTLPTEFYPHALNTMQTLTKRSDVILIMYTCSWPNEIKKYLQVFVENNIVFDYVNKNPEVSEEGYGYYVDKPYGNIFLDDKAGFDPYLHWSEIQDTLSKLPTLIAPNSL